MTSIETYNAVCPSCNQWTTIGISDSAVGAVANCDCGNAWFVSRETGEKPNKRSDQ